MIYIYIKCVAVWDPSFTGVWTVSRCPPAFFCAIHAVKATATFLLLQQMSSRLKGTFSLIKLSISDFLYLKFHLIIIYVFSMNFNWCFQQKNWHEKPSSTYYQNTYTYKTGLLRTCNLLKTKCVCG